MPRPRVSIFFSWLRVMITLAHLRWLRGSAAGPRCCRTWLCSVLPFRAAITDRMSINSLPSSLCHPVLLLGKRASVLKTNDFGTLPRTPSGARIFVLESCSTIIVVLEPILECRGGQVNEPAAVSVGAREVAFKSLLPDQDCEVQIESTSFCKMGTGA